MVGELELVSTKKNFQGGVCGSIARILFWVGFVALKTFLFFFLPNENFAFGTSVFREFFPNLTEVLIILKLSKKRSNYESSVYLRKCGGSKKIIVLHFLLFLTKIIVTG